MPLRSTFKIGTQIIFLKIDGFLKGWILNITPLKCGKSLFEKKWVKLARNKFTSACMMFFQKQGSSFPVPLNNKRWDIAPWTALVSPPGGFASLSFDQGVP